MKLSESSPLAYKKEVAYNKLNRSHISTSTLNEQHVSTDCGRSRVLMWFSFGGSEVHLHNDCCCGDEICLVKKLF